MLRSSRVVSVWPSIQSPEFDPRVLKHSGIYGAAVLNNILEKKKSKNILLIKNLEIAWMGGGERGLTLSYRPGSFPRNRESIACVARNYW
jgi:hypothetical protein